MKPKRMANFPKVPWITADGALDPAKLPIDSVLQQCVQADPDKFRSGCRTLSMMAYCGRVDAAVFLLGLLRYYEDDWSILEAVVEGLSSFRDPRCAAALFGELRRVKSSNTTRRYLGVVIRTLARFPREMVRERFLDLAADPAYTYRMRAKFSAAAEGHCRLLVSPSAPCGRTASGLATQLQSLKPMLSFRVCLILFLLGHQAASGAALVPVPGPGSALPVTHLEANRGQAKPEILFLSRGAASIAAAAQWIDFSPLGVRLSFVAGNPNPAVRFIDPLPGVVNVFSRPDPRNWVTGIPRHGAAQLAEVYPGVDARYAMSAGGELALKLLFRAGADPKAVVLEVARAVSAGRGPDGSLHLRLGPSRLDPVLSFPPPTAFQETASGPAGRNVSFDVQSAARFGFEVEGRDENLPLEIEMKLAAPALFTETRPRHAADAEGNMFVAATVTDAAGKDAPFPSDRWAGCGTSIAHPIACSDVAVYKFAQSGELIFASYFAGRTNEEATFLGLAADGTVVVTGSTDSADFPVTAGALQPVYAGPAATPLSHSGAPVAGDLFAVKLDPTEGAPIVSTYFGGPNADAIGETALGADGSLYFMPKFLGRLSAGMLVTRGALQPECAGDPCANGYAARVSPALERLLYGTYVPGKIGASAKLHSDGSVYYAGFAEAGFPTTPGAYQERVAGKEDAIVARLDPSGSRLLFATYIGGPETDWILRMAVAPDGSVWAAISSFVVCCIDIQYRLVRLDAEGRRILADRPIDVGDLAVDRDGNLHATAVGQFTAGPDAFLAHACAWSYLAYIKLSPSGEQLFATYLPASSGYEFDGTGERGLPVLWIWGGRFEVVEGQSMGVFAGCVVDAASFGNSDAVSPGAIMTLFGSRMGPREGVAFQLENGRVPAALGGTRVLVNGEPVPVLYASYWQVNAILPYSLPVGTRPVIQVESDGAAGNELGGFHVQRAGLSLFRLDDSALRPAAALNEDYTVNTPGNPVRRGSSVMLFGTGGGATVPPSVAGEVTPLEIRVLQDAPQVRIWGGPPVTVEYAGAAPGLLAGVTQINIKLPDTIPEIRGFPRGVVPLQVETPRTSFYPGYVTVAVKDE